MLRSYNLALRELARHGDWEGATALLADMRRCGGVVTPDLTTYKALLRGEVSSDKWCDLTRIVALLEGITSVAEEASSSSSSSEEQEEEEEQLLLLRGAFRGGALVAEAGHSEQAVALLLGQTTPPSTTATPSTLLRSRFRRAPPMLQLLGTTTTTRRRLCRAARCASVVVSCAGRRLSGACGRCSWPWGSGASRRPSACTPSRSTPAAPKCGAPCDTSTR